MPILLIVVVCVIFLMIFSSLEWNEFLRQETQKEEEKPMVDLPQPSRKSHQKRTLAQRPELSLESHPKTRGCHANPLLLHPQDPKKKRPEDPTPPLPVRRLRFFPRRRSLEELYDPEYHEGPECLPKHCAEILPPGTHKSSPLPPKENAQLEDPLSSERVLDPLEEEGMSSQTRKGSEEESLDIEEILTVPSEAPLSSFTSSSLVEDSDEEIHSSSSLKQETVESELVEVESFLIPSTPKTKERVGSDEEGFE